MDIREHNRAAWDTLAQAEDRWTIPVTTKEVAAARRGEWQVLLTNTTPVPRDWFPPDLRGLDVLALASGGGQQAPLFAAAGARVTVLDNSPQQLARDKLVAKREGLDLRAVEGTMEDLSAFADASFDLVFHPTSILFARDARRVFREVARVLRPGGSYLFGFVNPHVYLFDRDEADLHARLVPRHRLPYADDRDLPADDLAARVGRREPLEFSHTMQDLLGGQTDAGLHITGFYEDRFGDATTDEWFAGLFATRAVKQGAR